MNDRVAIWDVEPYTGVGAIAFGLSRAEVRAMLGNEFSTFRKGPYAINDTDAYKDLGAHFEYDENDRLECMDLVGPVPVNCCGISLLNLPIEHALEKFNDLGLSHRYDDGYFIDQCGIALYVCNGAVRAVTVYRKGYYDD